MTEPTFDATEELSNPDESVVDGALDETGSAGDNNADGREVNDEDSDAKGESPQEDEPGKPAARQVTVKLPDEPYDFTQCVVTITLGILPSGDDPNDRRVVAMIDSHGEAPTKVLALNLAQMQPIPPWLQELLDAHIAALPAREAAARVRKDEEARRAAERQARSGRTATRNHAAGRSGAKGKLARLGDAQDVLFDGGESMTVAAPVSSDLPPSPAPPPVQTPPAQFTPPQPKPDPAPAALIPQAAAPLTVGSVVAAPTKRSSKKQPPLQEADAVQDVLFG